MTDMKMTDQFAGHEIAGHENAGLTRLVHSHTHPWHAVCDAFDDGVREMKIAASSSKDATKRWNRRLLKIGHHRIGRTEVPTPASSFYLIAGYCHHTVCLSVSLSEQMTRHRLQHSAVVATIGCGDNPAVILDHCTITIVGPRFDWHGLSL